MLLPSFTVRSETFRTVAVSNPSTVGTQRDGFLYLYEFDMSNVGHIAFDGIQVGDDLTRGIWLDNGQSRQRLIGDHEQFAGAPVGFEFGLCCSSKLNLNEAGQIVLVAGIFNPVEQKFGGIGIIAGHPGDFHLIARAGSDDPNASVNVSFDLPFFPQSNVGFNSAGQATFRGRQTGEGIDDGNDSGVWLGSAEGVLQQLAREGEPVPGAMNGEVFDSLTSEFTTSPIDPINSQGHVLVTGRGSGPGQAAILFDGALHALVRSSEPAPGAGSAMFSTFSPYSGINSQGDVALGADLYGGGVTEANDRGIWLYHEGQLDLVVRTGRAMDGILAGNVLNGLWPQVAIGDGGDLVFQGSLREGTGDSTHETNAVVFGGKSAALRVVAREGDLVPGGEGNERFGEVFANFNFRGFSDYTVNARGQVAFSSSIVGGGVDDANNFGIWAEDPLGALRLIARTGQSLDVDEGPQVDLRVINGLRMNGFTGNADGRPSSFNDRGEFAFFATFTDGSQGIFISRLVAIPEPAAMSLVGAGAAFLWFRRRRIESQ